MSRREARGGEAHGQIEPLLAVYRELDEAGRRRVDSHVRTCAACARQLARFQEVDHQLWRLRERHQTQARFQGAQPNLAAFRSRRDEAGRPVAHLARLRGVLNRPFNLAAGLAGAVLLVAAALLFASWFASLSRPVAGLPDSTRAEIVGEEGSAATGTRPTDLGRIAYVQEGDIWVKSLPGGEPRRLTDDGDNQEPNWSPSGEWLAFRKGAFLWVLNVNAPEEARSLQTTAGGGSGGFSWSPVADQLAFTAGNELQLLDAGNGTITNLVSLPEDDEDMYRVMNPFWKPDGAAIAYEQFWVPVSGGETFRGDHGVWLVGAQGGRPRKVYDSGLPEMGEALLAGWTGDGEHLLFWQSPILSASALMDGVPLYALPATGGEPLLIGSQGLEDAALSVLPRKDFIDTALGTSEILLTIGSGRETWQNKRIALGEPESGTVWAFTGSEKVAIRPERSPEGSAVAYSAMRPDQDGSGRIGERLMQRHIEIADLSQSGEPRLLADNPAYRDERPLWSADGSHILFARIDRDQQASLWLIPAGGGEAQRVVDVLSPPPADTGWLGVFGYVDWSEFFDWWHGQ